MYNDLNIKLFMYNDLLLYEVYDKIIKSINWFYGVWNFINYLLNIYKKSEVFMVLFVYVS